MSLSSPEVWFGATVIAALGLLAGYFVAHASMAYRHRRTERLILESMNKPLRVPQSILAAVDRALKADLISDGCVDIALKGGEGAAVVLFIKRRYKISNVGLSARDYRLPFDNSRHDVSADRTTVVSLRINGEHVDTNDSRYFVIEPGSYSSRSLGQTVPINPGESASIEFATRKEMQDRDSLTWSTMYPAEHLRVRFRCDLDLRISISTLGPTELLTSEADDSDSDRSFELSGLLPGQGFLLAWERSSGSDVIARRVSDAPTKQS